MTKQNSWIDSAKRLYFWNFVGWAIATGLLLIKPLIDYLLKADFIDFSFPTYAAMFAALPGTLYFFLLSKKLNQENLPSSHELFTRIMKGHNLAGIVALVGAVVGVLPFLVNFIGIFTIMGDQETLLGHIWLNLNLILPWVSLYGFVTFYLIALRINKERLKTLATQD